MQRPPDTLYLIGVLPRGRRIAIVGTRHATLEAIRFTQDLAARMCREGWSVWSGGAAGIDSAAHQGAVDAGGKSVVVMGTGFSQPYPAGNANLFRQVLDADGAWLSLYPEDRVGSRWSFLARNELLAAMVSHVVVVQAPIRSGARSTMSAARRMGKSVWAVPGSPWDSTAEGCLREIEAGAKPLIFPEQILGRDRAPTRSLPADLSPNERAVLEAVRQGPVHLDGLCERSGLTFADACATALSLTLKRLLLESADGRYVPADQH